MKDLEEKYPDVAEKYYDLKFTNFGNLEKQIPKMQIYKILHYLLLKH